MGLDNVIPLDGLSLPHHGDAVRHENFTDGAVTKPSATWLDLELQLHAVVDRMFQLADATEPAPNKDAWLALMARIASGLSNPNL